MDIKAYYEDIFKNFERRDSNLFKFYLKDIESQ